MHIRNILLATDFSPCSQAALEYARYIAKRYHSFIYLVHVISESTYADVPPEILPQARLRAADDARNKLQHIRSWLTGLQAECILEEGPVADTLLALTETKSIDLLVVGTQGHRRMDRLLLGSVAEKLSRQARCPVLVVPESAVSYDSKVAVRTILCPTNFSDRSVAALKQTWPLAKSLSARIILLHVAGDSTLSREDQTAQRPTIEQRLSRLSSTLSTEHCSPEADLVVEFGDSARTILKVAAERNVDLIVLSIQRAKPVVAHLPPEITYSVAQQAFCPVLTIAS